jgi:hypothetical protein
VLDRVLVENPLGPLAGADLIDVEADALGERKFKTEIDRAGDAPHVALPHVRARLAPTSCFFLAAECAANLGAGRSNIDINDPAVGTLRG